MEIGSENPDDKGKNQQFPGLDVPQEVPGPISLRVALVSICVLLVLAVFIGYAFDMPTGLPNQDDMLLYLRQMVEMARSSGHWGEAVIIALYAIGVVIAAPSALMTYAVTLVYGLWAIPIAFLGALFGLSMAYFVSRHFMGPQIAWFCARYPITRGIETALMRNGFWIILLMRQSPIVPFAAQNYLFGVLGVRPQPYLTASTFGIIPGTIAKVYIFDTANKAALDPSMTTTTYIVGGLGILATIFVMWLVGKAVAHELRQASEPA